MTNEFKNFMMTNATFRQGYDTAVQHIVLWLESRGAHALVEPGRIFAEALQDGSWTRDDAWPGGKTPWDD